MTQPTRILILISAAVLTCLGDFSSGVEVEGSGIRSQDVAGNVIWTRREDRCTLQILVDWKTKPASMSGTTLQKGVPQLEAPLVEVWLLKADGTVVPPERRWETPRPKPGVSIRERTMEVNYTFPLSASTDAVAVAIRIDGNFSVKKLTPFSNVAAK